ncbi:MAG: protein-glutamate O-methyltransferase CheR [Isosphaeraceae bacterium]
MQFAELSVDEYDRFCALIYKVAGIRIPPNKKVMITNRLRRRLRATGIEGFSAYYTFLTSPAGGAEMPQFLDEITTNETYFHRDVHHFDWLSDSFFPEIAAAGRLGKRPKRLRIWSAAASTGEEPYSIALRLAALKHQFVGWTTHLLGTDISAAALAAARVASYDDRSVRLIRPDDRARYFDHDENAQRWILKPEIRSMVTWKLHNLMSPLREEPFDCIFIKNVLIYFDTSSKLTVTRNLIGALAKGGYLVVGPTEGIYSMLDPLEKLKPWLYRRSPD